MKKMYIGVAFACTLLLGCNGDDGKFTWGDGIEMISGTWAQKLAICGIIEDSAIEKTARHAVYHSCVHDDVCDVELPEPARTAALKCTKETRDTDDCVALAWGILPAVCSEYFEYDPRDDQ